MGSSVATRLSDAIDEHLDTSAAYGATPATIKSKRGSLDKLLLNSGNILMRNVGPEHVAKTFVAMKATGMRASSINVHRSNLSVFFGWAQSRRYLVGSISPMEGTRRLKEMPRERLWVPSSKFDHLLDCASHPRNRMITALGLYLFLRQSEIKNLTVQDVNLEDGFVTVIIYKTKQRDEMPICAELEVELRRWLTYYSQEMDRPLRGDWFLVPARTSPLFQKGKPERRDGLKPLSALTRLHAQVQGTLDAAGYSLHTEAGDSAHEGVHTLRRSGARARYDYLVDVKGYDGALREVQAMLHHASTSQTEHYLGITLDKKKRNESIRGQRMFPAADTSNLIHLSDRRVD